MDHYVTKEDFICRKCGKQKYDKRTAQTKRNLLMRNGKQKSLRIYQCGDYWHLTSKP